MGYLQKRAANGSAAAFNESNRTVPGFTPGRIHLAAVPPSH